MLEDDIAIDRSCSDIDHRAISVTSTARRRGFAGGADVRPLAAAV
jgi:hypothetical protein